MHKKFSIIAGILEAGGPGGRHSFWHINRVDRGQIMPTPLLRASPDFQTLQDLCVAALKRNLHDVYT